MPGWMGKSIPILQLLPRRFTDFPFLQFKGTEPVVGQCYSTSDKVIDKPSKSLKSLASVIGTVMSTDPMILLDGVDPLVFWCNDSHQD